MPAESAAPRSAAGPFVAAIAPVPPDASRPRWSVMIPTFNCADTLAAALEGVLAQDPGPSAMQIEVVDDCSTRDDPERVVASLAPGRVTFVRQPHNVGHIANFNTCIQRSRGELVHLLHGDDQVRDGFYATLEPAFRRPEIGAAFCRSEYIDEHGVVQGMSPLEQPHGGVLDGWLERIAVGQRLQPPSIVVRRDVYERLGGFDRRIAGWAEDWEMWLRVAAHHAVWYEPRPLAAYRLGGDSLTRVATRDGRDIVDCCRVVQIATGYLPPQMLPRLSDAAREECVLGALRRIGRRLDSGQTVGVGWRLVARSIRCARTPRVMRALARTLARRYVVGARARGRHLLPVLRDRFTLGKRRR